MSRVLFVVPPLPGHVDTAATVAAELVARGHEVAWAGEAAALRRVIGARDTIYACAGSDRPHRLRDVAVLEDPWEEFFGPLAIAMAPGITMAVLEFVPDLLVVDQRAIAGSLVAERLAVPYVTMCTTSAEPKAAEWTELLLDRLRQRLGDPSAVYDPRFSPWFTLVFSTVELLGEEPAARGPLHYVGPAFCNGPEAPGFPWDWADNGDERELVVITSGDSADGFLRTCVAAVRERADLVRAIVADPGNTLGGLAPDEDVLVVPRIPQRLLMGRADAMICRAAHATVMDALLSGVPLVLAPARDEEPVLAAQVAAAGAGVRMRTGHLDAERVGHALDSVLMDPGYAAAAQRIRESFRSAGGAAAAANHLDTLARTVEEDPWGGSGLPLGSRRT